LAILGFDTRTSRTSRESSTTIDFPTPSATKRAAGSPAARRAEPVGMSSAVAGLAATCVTSSAEAGRGASLPAVTASAAASEAGMRILIIVSSAGLFGGGRRADAEAHHVETAIRPVVLARGVGVGAGDQDVDGIDLDGRRRAGGRSTGEIGGYATGAEGDGKDDGTRGSHTLHFPTVT